MDNGDAADYEGTSSNASRMIASCPAGAASGWPWFPAVVSAIGGGEFMFRWLPLPYPVI